MDPNSNYCLETKALCKQYKNFKALIGVDIHVPKGAIYGLVGQNGAGKTTLIRLLCGLQNPTSGTYSLYGIPHTSSAIHTARKRMGAVVETPALQQDMTARENLEQQYRILGLPWKNGMDDLLALVGLADTGKKKAKAFSLGMRQRLGIALALCGSPDLLVLDEPVNGLDPQGIVEIRELILTLNREHGITVLVSSHILDELSKMATDYGFIENGRIIREISAAELEKACRKCVRIEVTNTKILARVLDGMGMEYKILSDTQADVFGKFALSPAVLSLHEKGCEVLSANKREESLESYYVNLVGNGKGEERT